MDDSHWSVTKLAQNHDRKPFDCGVDELNNYLIRYVGQNERAGLSQHFVAVDTPNDSNIRGYYALSAGAVAFSHLSAKQRRHLPRYPVPVAHIGRLAVARDAQGEGLGEFLLMDALARTLRVGDQIGIHAIEVLAINDSARTFYLKYGFEALHDEQRHLYLPISAVRKLGLL